MGYQKYIQQPSDLITSYTETRAGFIAIALEKGRQATPFIDQAKILKRRIENIAKPIELLDQSNIHSALIAAAGISEKAAKHLGPAACLDAISQFIEQFLIPAGEGFKEELIFRFLLTKGDSLGGSMRNILGLVAKRKLNNLIIAALGMSGLQYVLYGLQTKQWILPNTIIDTSHTKGIFWRNKQGEGCCLFYDVNVPLVGNNIDIVLLRAAQPCSYKLLANKAEQYIALGELKGGIDPAGADEHWKTAKNALDRIIHSFQTLNIKPNTLYIGAAIVPKMAGEIYRYLAEGYLNHAANLTKDEQMAEIVEWLTGL